ncbi:hypothetical protein BMETH_2021_0 [methanotrophic bacterial endosymbiont of Bathymodiolus sp.]|nr:hypothetical protein BMETH_2021_0 [methanotrophic bacterial endosymbiont of Bathymodiolus sp.]
MVYVQNSTTLTRPFFVEMASSTHFLNFPSPNVDPKSSISFGNNNTASISVRDIFGLARYRL